jgi:thioredoxin 1
MSAAPVHVTAEAFESEVIKSEQPVVIDFWAPWCGPCRSIGPVLDKLAARYDGQVKVAKVNVDEQPELANAFKITGIPTLYVMQKGEVIGHMVGFGGAKALEDLFAQLAEPAPEQPAAVN